MLNMKFSHSKSFSARCNVPSAFYSQTVSGTTPGSTPLRKFEGKVPASLLSSVVFPRLGARPSPFLLQGPKVGVDGALLSPATFQGQPIVITSDPITGSIAELGRLSVIVNANDVSVMGGVPSFMVLTLLLPPDIHYENSLRQIMTQVHESCIALGVSVIGGHTEVTSAVTKPVACVTMFGAQKRRISPAAASEGDVIVMTKSAGIEGTHILLSEFPDVLVAQRVFSQSELEALAIEFRNGYKYHVSSVTHEAGIAIENTGVSAMHDPTEGGLASALIELQEASGVGMTVNLSSIERTCLDSTRRLCRFLTIDAMNLIGSGSLLITVAPNAVEALMRDMEKNNVRATIIGVMTRKGEACQAIDANGDMTPLIKPETDALWGALEKMSALKAKKNE